MKGPHISFMIRGEPQVRYVNRFLFLLYWFSAVFYTVCGRHLFCLNFVGDGHIYLGGQLSAPTIILTSTFSSPARMVCCRSQGLQPSLKNTFRWQSGCHRTWQCMLPLLSCHRLTLLLLCRAHRIFLMILLHSPAVDS